jgi:hypothetical protein
MSSDKNMKTAITRHRQNAGQTLIIALVVLTILAVLGLIFTGIVGRNILQTQNAKRRDQASDFAEAGIRYAHSQLLNSASGADWRGELIDLGTTDFTTDPDMLYLRPGSGRPFRSDTDTVLDLGGPDGLGHYTRVTFANGRALVRVRYSPSDANIFQTSSVGALRQPGEARSYLIIECVGRVGRILPNDPTTQTTAAPIQFRNYPDNATFRTALGAMRQADKLIVQSRKLQAFCSIGIIESARFITNFDRVTQPAEIGADPRLGVTYPIDNGGGIVNLNVNTPVLMGQVGTVPGLSTPSVGQANVSFGGSLHSNAPLKIHGEVQAFLNASLGEGITVAETIAGEDGNNFASSLVVQSHRWDSLGNVYQPQPTLTLSNSTNPSLNSRSNNFSTANGLIRDAMEGTDQQGFWRGVAYKAPPLMSWEDSQTGLNRYYVLTAQSGALTTVGNIGRWGHGEGVYVNNTQDRQIGRDEDDREAAGSESSLVHDWFNPGNKAGWARSGWKGQYYIPRGSYVLLTVDGFVISRDSAAAGAERTWRRPDGTDSGLSSIRYRIGRVGADLWIVNTLTPGVNINGALTAADYQRGRRFNGVLYFEGNVRVRGVIPTNVQLTLVSNATVYVEGSITKGVVDPQSGNRITGPSASSLMLMARDYVTINTTMFFGPTSGQNVEAKAGADAIVMNDGETIELQSEMLLDPNGDGANPDNPSTWSPFAAGGASGYEEFTVPGATNGNSLSSSLLVSHTMDDGPGTYAMVSMDVNYGIGTGANPSTYLFPLATPNSVLGIPPYTPGYVTPGFTTPNFVPVYGLGAESWQRFGKFEATSFTLTTPGVSNFNWPFLEHSGGEGNYRLLAQETNAFTFRPNPVGVGTTSNAYLLGRAAIVPHDIRIEASMYAERGSFVVIPGYWFNTNPNDTRLAFLQRVDQLITSGAAAGEADAVRIAWSERERDYGTGPSAPFYAEPIDVRVQIFGSISENMPLPMSYQVEWLKKWGWIPRQMGALYRFSGQNAEPIFIPWRHVPGNEDLRDSSARPWAPNLIVTYDSMLATGRVSGFADSPANPYVRVDQYGRPLPPMPRLPVSPTLSYFGEVSN